MKTHAIWLTQTGERISKNEEEKIRKAMKSIGWECGGRGSLSTLEGEKYDIFFTKKIENENKNY